MKTIADFPAFEVVDLELDIITLTHDVINAFEFCVEKQSIRHGMMYPGVSPYCVAYYAMDYQEDPVAREAQAKANGHDLYWINNNASVLCSDPQAKGVRYLLKEGQKIKMNGLLLEVFRKAKNSEYWGLREIAE